MKAIRRSSMRPTWSASIASLQVDSEQLWGGIQAWDAAPRSVEVRAPSGSDAVLMPCRLLLDRLLTYGPQRTDQDA